jgi:hypothetical protein
MKPLNLNEVRQYVEDHIGEFHAKRLERLEKLKLNTVLKRKNPYLFKAKNIVTAQDFVRQVLDAYLSSQEETLFGDFLERLAVFVCERVFDGYKPEFHEHTGIDLIFTQGEVVYMVEIKSGPHWGNSSQIKKMRDNFNVARAKLEAQYPNQTIVAVNGCAYGREKRASKRDGEYWKLCGQDFWSFISGDDDLYTKIIEPLGHLAESKNEAFHQGYARLINRFTLVFMQEFCDNDGAIDWDALVRFVSERDAKSDYPLRDDI